MKLDAIASFADAERLGFAELRLKLKTRADVDGTMVPTELWLGRAGLWIVGARDRRTGIALDALAPNVRYRMGRTSDSIEVAGTEFVISAVRRKKARAAVRVARARQRLDDDSIEYGLPQQEIGIREFCRGELLLDAVPGATAVPVDSDIAEELYGVPYLVVTAERAAWVASSVLGDVRIDSLEGQPDLKRDFRSATVTTARVAWTSAGERNRVERLVRVLELSGQARRLELARLEYLETKATRRIGDWTERPAVVSLLALLLHHAGALPTEPDVDGVAGRLAAETVHDVGDLLAEWQIPFRAARKSLAALRSAQAPRAFAVELHRETHAMLGGDSASPVAVSRADARLAAHLLEDPTDIEAAEEAGRLLKAALRRVPDEQLRALLPEPDEDLTQGAGGQTLRSRLLALLSVAQHRASGALDADVELELARLQPLVPGRLKTAAETATGSVQKRAQDAARIVTESVLPRQAPTPDARPLSDAELSDVLPHPLAREGSAMLGRVQSLLASVSVPDMGTLRDFCEQLDSSSPAGEALQQAARLLGIAGLRGYVSRGSKSVGVRAYEGSPPFVLVGGQHLDAESEYAMSPAELRFAIGAEVAHVKYEHSRVTSNEVWAGAWDKSKQSIDFMLAVLPIVKGWSFAGRLTAALTKIRPDRIRKVLANAETVNATVKRATGFSAWQKRQAADTDPAVLSHMNEELVAAHRVMQLTADRAGLVLAGDIAAAIRGILLVRRDYRAALETVAETGLETMLSRREEDGQMAYQDLAVRAGALIAFYLSDEYEALTDAARSAEMDAT